MNYPPITVTVKIDSVLFRDFAIFDTFRVKKQWRPPALFAIILLVFSIVCFSQYQTRDQAVLIGSVLLVIGFGLPIVYFANFFKSINMQIKKLRLDKPQEVYTITFSQDPEGIQVVTKTGETIQHTWDNVSAVHKNQTCSYLYIQNTRAYLLPHQDVGDQLENLWGLFDQQVIDQNKERPNS